MCVCVCKRSHNNTERVLFKIEHRMGTPLSVDKLLYEMRRLWLSVERKQNQIPVGSAEMKGRKVGGGNLSSLQMKVIKFINGIS